MSGAQLGGTISGAATGWSMGGPYGAIVGGVLGFLSSDDGSKSKIDLAYAKYNAQAALAAGAANASAIMAMAGFNSSMALAAGAMSANSSLLIAEYNGKLKSFIGDQNAKIYENDARLVWEKEQLDEFQMKQQFARQRGAMQVAYGASGVIMNQDSPMDAIVDAETKHAMDVMVLQHGADIQATKLHDAAARSRWEGNVMASQMAFEGRMNAIEAQGNATLKSAGFGAQGAIDSSAAKYNSELMAQKYLVAGNNASLLADSKDDQAMWNGLFSAASTYYSGSKNPNSNFFSSSK